MSYKLTLKMKKLELLIAGALSASLISGLGCAGRKKSVKVESKPKITAEDKVYTSKIEFIELGYPSKQLPGVNYYTETTYGNVSYTGYPSNLAPLEIERGSETVMFGPPPYYTINLDKHIDAYIPRNEHESFFKKIHEVSKRYEVAIWSSPSVTEFLRLLPDEKWFYNGEQTLDMIEFEKNVPVEEFIFLVSKERYDDAVRKYSIEKEKVKGVVDSIVKLYKKYEVKKKRR
mgnify:CR=1 FL=1